MPDSTFEVLTPPSRSNGSVARVVTYDGVNAFVEVWTAPPGVWKRSDKYTIRDVMVAPPASEEWLRTLGIPT